MTKKMLSIILALVMCLSLAVPAFAETSDEAPNEVFLTRVQISETTYEYLDEEGNVVVTLELTNEEPTVHSLDATTYYYFSWRIAAKSYTHGDVDLDVSDRGGYHVNVSMGNTSRTSTYIGYYTPINNEYHWIEPPHSDDLPSASFWIVGSHPINFAVKNDGNVLSRYDGKYWLTKD